MVSIGRPNLASLAGSATDSPSSLEASPIGSPVRDGSPISPKSWEDSLLELDSDLQKICGPTRSPLAMPGSYMKYGLSQSLNLSSSPARGLLSPPLERMRSSSPVLRYSQRRAVSQEGILNQSLISPDERPQSPILAAKPEYHRSQSYACGQNEAASARPLVVRHEQTSEKLAEKLSRICSPGQSVPDLPKLPASPKPLRAKHVMAIPIPVGRRPSLASAFNHDVPLMGSPLCDTAVSYADNRLKVMHFTACDSSILAEIEIPLKLDITRLMCGVEGEVMKIRERSKALWSCQTNSEGEQYLPVIQQNDNSHQLTVILHVPQELRYEDLSVRTIDDHLIISKKRSSYPGANASQYEVVLVLPDMGYSRGVDASLTHSNQLCIIVTFDSHRG